MTYTGTYSSSAVKPYKVGSMFAGIGGICYAFKQAGCDIVWANEIDKSACKTYRNFIKDNRLVECDIRDAKTSIPRIDILTAGFPCQPFSIAGKKMGFNDPRGKLFFEIIDVMKLKKPKAVFLENVANIINHDDGKTYESIRSAISDAGYCEPKCMIMNTKDYGGIPQFRNRAYIVAFREKKSNEAFEFPESEPCRRIEDMINISEKKDEKYYYSSKNAKHFDMFESTVTQQNVIYQWRRIYMRENKNGLCPTLTANMGLGGHNVPIILDDYGIRKLTPEECSAFQGFPKWFRFPQIPDGQKYKQIGNSVSIPVVKRIAESMITAMRGYN